MDAMKHIKNSYDCYEIGKIQKGERKIFFDNKIN